MSRFASYLWNVYDSKDDGDFMPIYLQGKEYIEERNNDDVDGLGRHVFEVWNNNPNENYDVFHTKIKNGLDDCIKTSIDYIYDFMDFDHDGNFDDMRSSQVISEGITCTPYEYTHHWRTGSYQDGDYSFTYGHDGYWGTAECNMRNFETDYKVNDTYYNTSVNSWTAWDCCQNCQDPVPDHYWTISAYNNSGSSCDPIVDAKPVMDKRADKEVHKVFNHEDLNLKTYPNPFTSIVNMSFNLNQNSLISVKLYNINMKLIDELYSLQRKSGYCDLQFNLDYLSSGTYFLKLLIRSQKDTGQNTIKIIKLEK